LVDDRPAATPPVTPTTSRWAQAAVHWLRLVDAATTGALAIVRNNTSWAVVVSVSSRRPTPVKVLGATNDNPHAWTGLTIVGPVCCRGQCCLPDALANSRIAFALPPGGRLQLGFGMNNPQGARFAIGNSNTFDRGRRRNFTNATMRYAAADRRSPRCSNRRASKTHCSAVNLMNLSG
jgi:hypothetical protein